MRASQIIAIRKGDAWFSIGVHEGCTKLQETPPTIKVWKPECVKPYTVCVGVDKCGNRLYQTIVPPRKETILTSTGVDCSGRAKFPVNEQFDALGAGRLDAELEVCGKKTIVAIQVMDTPLEITYATGSIVRYEPLVVDSVVKGEMAILKDGCRVPSGFYPVKSNGIILGYGRSYKSMGFCKEYRLTTDGCRVIYLK